jgi:hypothetical protein
MYYIWEAENKLSIIWRVWRWLIFQAMLSCPWSNHSEWVCACVEMCVSLGMACPKTIYTASLVLSAILHSQCKEKSCLQGDISWRPTWSAYDSLEWLFPSHPVHDVVQRVPVAAHSKENIQRFRLIGSCLGSCRLGHISFFFRNSWPSKHCRVNAHLQRITFIQQTGVVKSASLCTYIQKWQILD